jgi:hypothetical protein
MFETAIIVFVVSVLVLALGSALGRLALHVMYGPDLPLGVQSLAHAFTLVYTSASAVLLGPIKFFQRNDGVPRDSGTTDTPGLSDSEPKQIKKL